jgi:hypothetical protein
MYVQNSLLPEGTLISVDMRQTAINILDNVRDRKLSNSEQMILLLLSLDIDDSLPFYRLNTSRHHVMKEVTCNACKRSYIVSAASGSMYGPCTHCDALESFILKRTDWTHVDADNICRIQVKEHHCSLKWLSCYFRSLNCDSTFGTIVIPYNIMNRAYIPFMMKMMMYKCMNGILPDPLCVIIFKFMGPI